MEKYITSVNSLVIEAISKFSIITTSADKGDASSCFKMGMIHLLGINTAVDFKKAAKYLGGQPLANNQEAKRLLGFIAELEGNFSQAFHHYSHTENSEKDSYLDKVIKGRNHLQDYLMKLDLPLTLNKEISAVLSDYSKGKASKVGACIKIATICDDEQTCFEAAKTLYDTKDYISAINWLERGGIGKENYLYIEINKTFKKSMETLLNSNEINIVNLDSYSLLSAEDLTSFLDKVKKKCEEMSTKSTTEWKDKNKNEIDKIIDEKKEKEYQETLKAEAEEEKRMKRKKLMIKHIIVCLLLFIFGVSINEEKGLTSHIISGIGMILSCYFWYYVIIRPIWRKINK